MTPRSILWFHIFCNLQYLFSKLFEGFDLELEIVFQNQYVAQIPIL